MLGVVKKKNLVLRSGARVGDLIFVSGPLGDSILGRHLTFTPRVREAQDLVKNFKINAMIDISDGLVQDLGHILEASRTGAVIYENLIPKFKPTTRLEDALYAGEDFELIFTLSIPQARRLLSARFSGSHLIGHIVEQKRGFKLIDKQSQARTLTPKGFCHF
jgi:thiamine-monophosphate kinase